MKQAILLLLVQLCVSSNSFCQYAVNYPGYDLSTEKKEAKERKVRKKPVMYNTLGGTVPLGPRDIIVGGTSMAYKKFGTFLSYKLGILNFMLPEKGEMGEITYENVIGNKWPITGNVQQAVTFMLSGGLAIPITRRIPLYFGAGFTRYKVMFEYLDPFDNYKPKWNINGEQSRFELNYTAGTVIPLGRFLLNVGYDHNPQSIFVGIGISGRYVYEDVDDWWWGANKRGR